MNQKELSRFSLPKAFSDMTRTRLWLTLLCVLIGILFFLHLAVGSVTIPLAEVVSVLFGYSPSSQAWEYIIWDIRFPRALTAIIAGASLSIGGLQMQTLFKNPLAGPSVLGVTAGASLGVAFVILAQQYFPSFSPYFLANIPSWSVLGGSSVLVAACLGAAVVLGIVLALAIIIEDPISLLIVGIMMGYLSIALVSIWQYFSSPQQLQDFIMWTFGSLGGVSNSQIGLFVLAAGVGLGLAIISIKSLNLLLLGEAYARSLGISLQRTRILLIISTSILAGSVTGFCGPISFIGIAGPHLGRMIFKTNDHRILLPASLLMGACLLLFCDIIAQWPGSSIAFPINAITSLVGAPIVIWVILRRKGGQYRM